MARMKQSAQTISIPAPKWTEATFQCVGTSPLVINRFSEKARQDIRGAQVEGRTAKKRPRNPKDFKALYEAAFYRARNGGWAGVNALSFRNAMIGACRTTDYAMTKAKIALFVVADGFDKVDGMPLVKIQGGKPRYTEMPARNSNGGFDLRARPMWDKWSVRLRVRFDADQFSVKDIAHLLMRAGIGGVGEGRNASRMSNGLGWGMFEVKSATRRAAK